ncbi:hypothetical protein amyaer_2604 [Microcystis aeruginosa NIES-2481]|nr:hypothetical protein amyaer_2604 [Microcystis aeruginosa NIES-2481]
MSNADLTAEAHTPSLERFWIENPENPQILIRFWLVRTSCKY